MQVDGVNYNEDWVKTFASESDFLNVAKPMFGKPESDMQKVYRAIMGEPKAVETKPSRKTEPVKEPVIPEPVTVTPTE